MKARPLKSLEVENFRSISGKWEIPLDAPVVLIHGPNGSGKTSLLSAIELAATGNVAYLEEQTDTINSVLLNRYSSKGQVSLKVESEVESVQTGSFSIERDQLEGKAALSATSSHQFVERCYLPQTALGRLLETYTATGKQVDTALVSFVKSIVGLDELDNLIAGLHSAGHISRAKKTSKWWSHFDEELSRAEARRSELISETESAQQQLSRVNKTIESLTDGAYKSTTEQILSDLLLETDNNETLVHQYGELNIRLEGISNAYSQASEKSLREKYQNQTLLVQELSHELATWESGAGKAATSIVNTIRTEVFSLPEISDGELLAEYDDCRGRLEGESKRRRELRDRIAQTEVATGKLRDSLVEIDQQLASVEASIDSIQISSDTQILLEVLEKTIHLVTSNTCPICDQTYEPQDVFLSEHLRKKIDNLSQDAQKLLELQGQQKELIAKSVNTRQQIEAIVTPTGVSTPLTSLQTKLESHAEQVEEGRNLFDTLQRAKSREANFASLIATQDAARRSLSQLRHELKISDSSLSVEDEISRLKSAIAKRIDGAREQAERRQKLTESIKQALRLHKTLRDLSAELSGQSSEIAQHTNALEEAAKKRSAANQLRLDAERIRSSVINGVFDESLNLLWADLFNRFVPQEPFVPRFKKQQKATRSVDIRLETVMPNGDSSGTPSSMLSYGNTNTAALSLFIALNLAAPAELPCLIFDDPVQSMDDVHIANFATVVRELAYRHGRQVVIAVHQRELFEYLALELSPTLEDESLLKVSLNRLGQETIIDTERLVHSPEVSIVSGSSLY